MKPIENSQSTDSVFNRAEGSSESETWQERLQRFLDMRVFAPLRVMANDWRGLAGTAILAAYLLMGTVGVMLVEQPTIGQGPRLVGFLTEGFLFGTDNEGKDLFALMVHATPPMLKMITSGALFTTGVGTIVGTASGYKGGMIDRLSMIVTDIMLTIPGLPLIIVLATIFDPQSPIMIGILLSVNAWAGLARTIRSQVLTVREESYVEASRVLGFSTGGILRRDIVPQLLPFIGVNFMQSARNIIFSSVGLYFLGVLPYTTSNWGIILDQAYGGGALSNLEYFHWLLVPMVTISLMSLSLILLTQSADRVFNPRVRARHAETVSDEGATRHE